MLPKCSKRLEGTSEIQGTTTPALPVSNNKGEIN